MFRFESPMVAVATLLSPPPSFTATHRSIPNFQCSIFPLTHFTAKKSVFSIFHSFTSPHHYATLLSTLLLLFICRHSAPIVARSNHLKIYVKMITVIQLLKIVLFGE